MKQMEYNTKYSQHLNYIKYLADKNKCRFRILGSFNTYLHIENQSDIDIHFYTNNPYVVFHSLKNEIMYRKLMQRNYHYEMPCIRHVEQQNTNSYNNLCKGKGVMYKIDFIYKGVDISIMVIHNNDIPFFNGDLREKNRVIYYFGFLLYILKYIYYNMKLISKKLYKDIKRYIFQNDLVSTYKIYFDDGILREYKIKGRM